MNKQKQKSNTTKNKRKVFPKIIALVFLLIALGLGVYVVTTYVKQQQTLRELENAGQNLNVTYDRLLEINKNNVLSSNFGKYCTESNAKFGRGTIVCRVEGEIVLKEGVDLETAKKALDTTSFQAQTPAKIYRSEHMQSVSITYEAPQDTNGIECEGISSTPLTAVKKLSYNLSCRKTVPDFLPGYTIVD